MDTMYLPPELLAHIASFLDAESCLACVSVCRQWNQFFAPYLWHTVKISEQPWARLFSVPYPSSSSSSSSPRPPGKEQQQLISCLVKKYARYIRVLEMDTAWLLWGAMIGRVNGLLSLTFRRPSPELARSNLGFEGCQVHVESSEAVPYSVFDVEPKDYASPNFKMTLACWHMVLHNRDLQHIAFQQQHQGLGDVPLKVQEDGDHVYGLTPAGKSFLINLLSRLPDLRHVEIGQNADDFLLVSLAEHFPMVTSFVHLGTMAFDPSVLPRLPGRHPSLQSLSFKMSDFLSIEAEQLRWIVTAFPGLQHLSVPGYFSGALLGSLGWNDIDNCSIQTLSVSDFAYTAMEADLSVFEKAKITFRAVKELKRTGEEYELFGDLFRILRFFPCLERLEFARDAEFSDPLVGGSIGDCGGGMGGGFVDDRDSVYRFKTLALGYEARLSLDAIAQLTSESPYLTRVTLQDIHPAVVRTLAYSCQALEYVHFNTDESCSLELNTLLVHCRRLKECTGRGHVVFATDILRSQHWTCLGLQKLDITIVDVPRAKGEEVRLLERTQKRIRRARGQHGVVHDMILDTSVEQQSTQESQPKSQLCQRKVFSKLARLTQLEEVDFRYRPSEGRDEADEGVWDGEERMDEDETDTETDVSEQYWASLEFTLEAGLEQLGVLEHLRMIAFGVEDGKFGQRERDWVRELWCMNEIGGEKGVFCAVDLM
ncbi:hypothetical protein KI688_012906 [Linnemannia hyalina]|uniref:F-box domain-containing protein n=1 Tax=Linnemannia hyalina TaxID=64524 RepID=A0A9P7XTE3_9FUNG|nr:hypothetical protein KI688_012906 [Linnemannia hyalina]